jgi:phage gp29-like protein
MAAKRKATGEPIASAEAVKQYRRQRWNPLRTLSPETLTRALEAFEYGDLREFALLAETIAERDDTLKSVKPKREKATAHRDWNVMKREKSATADRHAEVLEEFWNNVRAENAYDRNIRGGMRLLIQQMMTAVSFKYAAHHIVWRPEPGKLRATFELVPLWFCENRTGKLRFIRDGVGIDGEEMPESEWMVTCGDGLMIACSIGYLAKRYCLQDWLAFSEKFSMPGIVGATSAAKGTPEGLAMKAAVEAFGQDWTAVMYGVADPTKPPIHLISPNGNPSAMPMPALIERVDRKMAALYRGADLSSMSSGASSEGTGASLQSEESDILEADDCAMISETLQGVERQVIEWYFGKGVEPLAYIEVQPPVREDKSFLIESMEFLSDKGVRIAKGDALERLGFAEADEADEVLGVAAVVTPDPLKVPAANAKAYKDFTDFIEAARGKEEANAMRGATAVRKLRTALAADMQPLGDALFAAYSAGDEPAMRAALKKISADMPELAKADGLAAELSRLMTAAYTHESDDA